MVQARTIRPGEMTAQQVAGMDSAATELDLAREALDVARRGVGGGNRPLWGAVVLLAAAFVWHIQGDGTLREEQRKTKVMVGWLVERDLAREHGLPLPPFPYDAL